MLECYCDHDSTVQIYRTDQDDAAEGRTASDDADGDHVIVRTNGSEVELEALSNGVPLGAAPSCS